MNIFYYHCLKQREKNDEHTIDSIFANLGVADSTVTTLKYFKHSLYIARLVNNIGVLK